MAITNPTVGINTTYDLTTGIPVNMDELIYMISPDDSPLINGINSDGHQIIPVAPVDETSFSWLDEERLTPQTTISGAVLSTATTILLATGTRNVFQTGDLLKVQIAGDDHPEIMLCTGYNGTAHTIDVTRDYAGTTGAIAFTGGETIVGLGTVLTEGSDPEAARSADRTERTNYTQIFGPTKVEMSRTEQNRRKYGVSSEFTHQLMNRMTEDVIRRERALLYGVKYTDSAGIRISGGIDYWIANGGGVTSAATTLTVANIEAAMQSCYDNGGVPNVLTTNPAAVADLADVDNTSRVRLTFDDPRRGRARVLVVVTEFGDVTVARNRWCLRNNAFMWNRSQATRRVFDGTRFERLAKTGDSDKGQIVCEEGLEFKGAQHAARFPDLA
jgi:hypothetical protein